MLKAEPEKSEDNQSLIAKSLNNVKGLIFIEILGNRTWNSHDLEGPTFQKQPYH